MGTISDTLQRIEEKTERLQRRTNAEEAASALTAEA